MRPSGRASSMTESIRLWTRSKHSPWRCAPSGRRSSCWSSCSTNGCRCSASYTASLSAEPEATVAVARAERALAAERTKSAPRPDDGSRKRSGRLVRVMADEGAWRVLRVDVERRRQSLGVRLARRLVAAEVDGDTEGRAAPTIVGAGAPAKHDRSVPCTRAEAVRHRGHLGPVPGRGCRTRPGTGGRTSASSPKARPTDSGGAPDHPPRPQEVLDGEVVVSA